MKRLLFAAPMLALSACAGLPGLATGPGALAERTTLDEQGLLGIELAYKAARLATETAVDAGLIRGETAARVAGLDNAAYAALGAARSAYSAGNAATYALALGEAQGSLRALLALADK